MFLHLLVSTRTDTFINDTAISVIYTYCLTRSRQDALPIYAITDRGFKHVFQTSATGGVLAGMTLKLAMDAAVSAGKPKPKSFAWISDNTAAPARDRKSTRLNSSH